MSSEVDRIRNGFPDDLQKLLDFFEKGDYVIAKPKHYLAGEDFRAIASVTEELGGDYISAGKESHFRVPKTSEKDEFLTQIRQDLEDVGATIGKIVSKIKEAGY